MAMIALMLDGSDQELIASRVSSAFEGSPATLNDPSTYHVTIANLGPLTMTDVARIQRQFEFSWPRRVKGVIGGAGFFTPDDESDPVIVLHFDSPQLLSIKSYVDSMLNEIGVPPSEDHGFTPHITVARGGDLDSVSRLNFNNQTLIFNHVDLVVDNIRIPLGYDPLTEEKASVNVAPAPMKSFEISPEGDLHILVYGVPFGGPEYLDGKDLHEERFDKNTDIGPLEKVLSFWDHAKVSDDPTYKHVGEYFGTDPIGIAEKVGMDDEGWIYKIIVDRRKKYFELLKRLADAKLIDASSTPFQRSAEKTADGLWTKWHVVEVALTPTAANPLARQLAKSISEEFLGDIMANKPNPETVVETADKVGAVETTEVTTTVVEQIEKVFAENPSEEAPNQEQESLAATLEKVLTRMDDIDKKLEKAMAIESSIADIKAAFPALASHIKTLVVGGVKREGQSQVEKDAEELLREKAKAPRKAAVSYLSPDAPGLN